MSTFLSLFSRRTITQQAAFASLMLASVAASSPAFASHEGDDHADECAILVADVKVVGKPSQPVIRTDATASQIQDFVGDRDVRGVTRTSFNVKVETHVLEGGGCKWLSEITATLRMTENEIFLPKEYAPGSCQYEAVLAHEMLHVKADRQIFADMQSAIRERLDKEGRDMNARIAKRPKDSAHAWIHLERRAKQIIEDFEDIREDAHSEIDRPEAYREISAACPSW